MSSKRKKLKAKLSSQNNEPSECSLEYSSVSKQVIVPSMIRHFACTFHRLDEDCCISLRKHSSEENKKKIKSPRNEREKVYLDKAMQFLANIDTENDLHEKDQHSENLKLVQNKGSNLHVQKNQAEVNAESLVQTWITSSGAIKKSYKHCLLCKGKIIPSSVNLADSPNYIQPSPLKSQLNSEFSKEHPQFDSKLTLSKIVNLREDLIVKMCKELNLEAFTVALAWSCFHKLLHLNLVNKSNRKLFASACVMLAYKFNEETHLSHSKKQLQNLVRGIHRLDTDDMLQAKEVCKAEFLVYTYLNFRLLLDREEYEINFRHTLDRLGYAPSDYLGKNYEVAFKFSENAN